MGCMNMTGLAPVPSGCMLGRSRSHARQQPNRCVNPCNVTVGGGHAGTNGVNRTLLDFGGIIDAVRVSATGVLSFQDLRIGGIAVWRHLDPSVVAGLPALSGSSSWPSIVSEVDSTVSRAGPLFIAGTPAQTRECHTYKTVGKLASKPASHETCRGPMPTSAGTHTSARAEQNLARNCGMCATGYP